MSGITFVGDEIDVTKYQGTMDLIYETANGYITAGAISDTEWQGMCKALEREDLINDERFHDTPTALRMPNYAKQITADEIAKWSRDDILERLDARGVPSAPLLTRLDLLEDEQIKQNEIIEVYDWDGHGLIRQAKPAAQFTNAQHTITRAAPLLGEHNEEIIAELG